MSTPILTTKFYTPPPRPERVSRPHLIERLEAGVTPPAKLTLVSAPAGFGKTTLIVEWLTHTRRPFSWLSLDSDDNDPTRFLIYLSAALRRLDPLIGQNLKQSAKLPPVETLITILINDLASLTTPFILVIDDYHLIQNPLVHHALELLLERQPPPMHLVLCTRQDPPLPLSRWRARGQVIELRQTDLKFTITEAGAFLNRVMQLNLPLPAISLLEERTEGWIAGLQLAALSLRGYERSRAMEFIKAFSGSHRYIIDYLVEEVVANQPEEIRHFLYQTAILGRLNASLCEAVTGRQDSRKILAQLEQANLFLIPLDEQRAWYRYHQLFSEFLRTESETRQQGPSLHQKAARWFEANHLPGEAIKHALAAQDVAEAGRLIGQVADTSLRNGELATLLNWLEALPEAMVRENPSLALARGWVSWLVGQGDAAESYLESALARWPAEVPASQQAKLLALQACLAIAHGQPEQSCQLARQALDQFEADQIFFRALALIILAEGHGAAGNTPAAIQTLQEAQALGRHTNDHFLMIGVMGNLADQLDQYGQRREAIALSRQMIEQYVNAQGQPWPMVGLAYFNLGLFAYEGNDLVAAQRYLDHGLALSQEQAILGPLIGGKILQAILQKAQGTITKALATLQEVRALLTEAKFEAYLPIFAAFEADFRLYQGDLAGAQQWASTAHLSPAMRLHPMFEFVYIIYARLLLNQPQPDPAGALQLLDNLEQLSRSSGHGRVLIIVHILQALAHAALGQERQALGCLGQAIELAAPQGYRRFFLDEGPGVAELLPHLRQLAPEFVSELLVAFGQEPAARLAGPELADTLPSPGEFEPVEALSDRELELLELVATGKSNSEIAADLFITVGTVKKHLNNIFGKLAVKNRTEAVARAREWRLVP